MHQINPNTVQPTMAITRADTKQMFEANAMAIAAVVALVLGSLIQSHVADASMQAGAYVAVVILIVVAQMALKNRA